VRGRVGGIDDLEERRSDRDQSPMVGVFVGLAIAVILGWTADGRADEPKLWPLGCES
jgi:hypothetical protein